MPAQARASVPHGGNLHLAIRRFGGPAERWIDLSSGINPHGYPVPEIGADAWLRLPDEHDGLAELAASYYGAPHALPVAGSQPVIRALPSLLPLRSNVPGCGQASAVGIAMLTYGEYAPAFARAGHRLLRYRIAADTGPADFTLAAGGTLPAELLHLVVVNPNNPSAEQFTRDTLLGWHAQLAARGGSLIVDEAFIDVTPQASVAAHSTQAGLVVLRSIGKFFGLAGARAGFTLAHPALLDALAAELGPWTLSGPARVAVRTALQDQAWQHATRVRLREAGSRLAALLLHHGLAARGTALFVWAPHPAAAALQERLARAAIWVRLFDANAAIGSAAISSHGIGGDLPSLRFGLPGAQVEWERLDSALAACRELIAATAR
jgi:cobalamin biosynthetic protein CobC